MTDFIKTAPGRTLENAAQDHFIAAEAPFSTVIRKRPNVAYRGSATASRRSTRCSTMRRTSPSAIPTRTRCANRGAAYISTGTKVISNEGRVMLTMTADSCGRHDTSAGACSCESNTVRFGHGTKYLHACRDNFVLEVSRRGMSKRDVVPNINFFMNVPIEPSGEMTDRRRNFRTGRLCGAESGDGCAARHLQLPADQQSLQRFRSDTDPGAGLGQRGLTCSRRF